MKGEIIRTSRGKISAYRARILGGYLLYWPKTRQWFYFA